jgi:Tol biopolymer transport system component
MPITPGTKLGPYEITARIGAGGMGEVFRARDTRLGRAVAIKVLPEEFAGDAARLKRFEQEARAASALNHPNIITVYEVGSVDHTSYLAMELVEGKSLRDLIEHGPLPVKRAIDLSAQIADGLAKAHDAGIVHRDLKPENIMISADGFAKILDFGLAKLTSAADDSKTAVKKDSTAGTLLGTAGYMSPEQAAGEKVDFRSDQFSFGTILYEMVSRARPFRRATTAETLAAIIRDEPDPLDRSLPAPLRWVIERCLAKDPEARYASTKDLARDLKSIRDHLSEADVPAATGVSRRKLARGAVLAAIVAIALVAAAFLAGRRAGQLPPPTFKQLTFRRGVITNARFGPNGRVVFAASWDGQPNALYENQLDNPDSRPLGLETADVLSITSTGQALVLLRREETGPFQYRGTLAQLSLGSSNAPRELLDNVREADWSADGKDLMVVRDIEGRSRIEMPTGRILYESAGWISSARVSRDGAEVAFIEHPHLNDDGGTIGLVDRNGKKRIVSKVFQSIIGLAWSPDNREVWFTGSKGGSNRVLYAINRSGRERILARTGGVLTLHDVAADGRIAITQDVSRLRAFFGQRGNERDFTWFDWTLPTDLTPDGKLMAFTEAGEGGGPGYSAFIRRTDGSPAVRLGDGSSMSISPDGQFVIGLSVTAGQMILFPTGAGSMRPVPAPGLFVQATDWMPDGKRVLFTASEPGHATRVYVMDVAGGAPRAISPEGFRQFRRTVTPDGKSVVVAGPDLKRYVYPIAGGAPRPLSTLDPGDQPTRWSADGSMLYIYRRGEIPAKAYRVNVQTGEKTLWREFQPYERAGVLNANPIIPTPDGTNYIAAYRQQLSDLFLLSGVR